MNRSARRSTWEEVMSCRKRPLLHLAMDIKRLIPVGALVAPLPAVLHLDKGRAGAGAHWRPFPYRYLVKCCIVQEHPGSTEAAAPWSCFPSPTRGEHKPRYRHAARFRLHESRQPWQPLVSQCLVSNSGTGWLCFACGYCHCKLPSLGLLHSIHLHCFSPP